MSEQAPGEHDITIESLVFEGEGGAPLSVKRFSAPAQTDRVAIIAAAMSTPQSFYAPFATWLAAQGFTVYTFDYQGFAGSIEPGKTLKDTRATMTTWGADARIMLETVRAREGQDARIQWIGQSLGSQLLGFTDTTELEAATIVACGTGSLHFSPRSNRFKAPLLWYVLSPLLTRAYGYFPGKKYRILGDTPPDLMRQWTRWCRRRDYMFHEHPELRAQYAAVEIPITCIAFSDDEVMSPEATAELESWYSGANVTSLSYTPEQLGRSRIGHMGIFRSSNAETWPTVFAHLVATEEAHGQH
ncbi:alpha/beta hydrolase [Leucobacter sp. UCMA 4100]|uniref:alpha/beta hydrolase family protein n=1 Tax=Leucobacter sp. UCMA 4100 TaxID=2810534 RepID=UPI0022EA2545|nr:alpha/beta fold hydrolase [Leucobacter sp. UCMA 4100]MDA3147618.1 alpha/beta hydrolase [Leucobacter sp. UCMA 4100]